MKSRTWIFIALGLIIFVAGLFTFSTRDQESVQNFPATINRDCAPWDGSAFTVSIPIAESVINISIYQLPGIRHPVTFSFPDEIMRDGIALLLLPVGSPERLTGKVSFQRVEQGEPVEGNFDLATEAGQQYKGKFKAEWGNVIAYCG